MNSGLKIINIKSSLESNVYNDIESALGSADLSGYFVVWLWDRVLWGKSSESRLDPYEGKLDIKDICEIRVFNSLREIRIIKNKHQYHLRLRDDGDNGFPVRVAETELLLKGNVVSENMNYKTVRDYSRGFSMAVPDIFKEEKISISEDEVIRVPKLCLRNYLVNETDNCNMGLLSFGYNDCRIII